MSYNIELTYDFLVYGCVYLGWDVPIQNFLPEFEVSDPLVSREITLSDLAAHLTGIPRNDGIWVK